MDPLARGRRVLDAACGAGRAVKVDAATAPPHLRSALFVPGHRADLLTKASSSRADALIVDLEDSVAPDGRVAARANVARLVAGEHDGGPRHCVRIHPVGHREHDADLAAALGPGLLAIVLPKVDGPHDVHAVEAHLGAWPAVRIWPLLESARAIQRSAEIAASSPRLAYLGGGTSRNGDLATSLGFVWTPEGDETMYLRSKVLIDARAADVPFPMTGVVTSLDDLSVVRAFAVQSRGLGYDGMMVIHPTHVAVANAVFGTSDEERTEARRILAALDTAAVDGSGATRSGAHMVDVAMRAAAERALLRRAAAD